MLSQRQISLTDYDLNYYQAGSGPCLVFLHGFFGNGQNWDKIINVLQSDYLCIAIDLLGFGHSSKPELKYDIWHQVRFIEEFIEALDVSSYSLIGHSYGGWAAAAYGVAYQGDALRQIGLIAPAGIRDDEFIGRYRHLRPMLWRTPLIDGFFSVSSVMARVLGQEEALEKLKRVRRVLLDQPVAASFLRDRLRPEDAIDTLDQSLDKIMVPTMIFAGRQDQTIPLWHCETYVKGIQNSSIHIYDDADHSLNQTHAVQIAETIRSKFHV